MVYDADARAAVPDPYNLPRRLPTAAQIDRAAHLEVTADAIFERATAAGFEGGSDAAFGYLAGW